MFANKYRKKVKKILNYNEYIEVINYLTTLTSEKTTILVVAKSFINIFRLLMRKHKMFFLLGKRKDVLCIDFESRPDHYKQLNVISERLNEPSILSLHHTQGRLISNSRLETLKIFFRLLPMCINISSAYKRNIFVVIESLVRFAKFNSFGLAVASLGSFKVVISLSFQTSPGFSLGLKQGYLRNGKSVKFVVIQHGAITKRKLSIRKEWREVNADVYICWNETYRKYMLSRQKNKCLLLIDGGFIPFLTHGVMVGNSQELEGSIRNTKISILYLASFSPYSSFNIIKDEIDTIRKLSHLASMIPDQLTITIRLHPSFRLREAFLLDKVDHIKYELPKQPLKEHLLNFDVICTGRSTAIATAVAMNKRVLILKQNDIDLFEGVLNSVDLSELKTIEQILEISTINLIQRESFLERMYGKKTNSLDRIVESIISSQHEINNKFI